MQCTEADVEESSVTKRATAFHSPALRLALSLMSTYSPAKKMHTSVSSVTLHSLSQHHIPDPHQHILPFSWQEQTCNKGAVGEYYFADIRKTSCRQDGQQHLEKAQKEG